MHSSHNSSLQMFAFSLRDIPYIWFAAAISPFPWEAEEICGSPGPVHCIKQSYFWSWSICRPWLTYDPGLLEHTPRGLPWLCNRALGWLRDFVLRADNVNLTFQTPQSVGRELNFWSVGLHLDYGLRIKCQRGAQHIFKPHCLLLCPVFLLFFQDGSTIPSATQMHRIWPQSALEH